MQMNWPVGGALRVGTWPPSVTPAGVERSRYDEVVAEALKGNSRAAARRAAAQRMRGMFADVAAGRRLVDELIAERRAEARAEDRAADATRRRLGG